MRVFLAGLLIAIVGALGFIFYTHQIQTTAEEPYGVPFELVDGSGAKITEQAFRGHPTVLFFGFTHCPEICPTTLFELNGWLSALGDEGKDVKAYFVTIDPERDTPEVLGDYVASVSDRVTAITGDPDAVRAMASGFGIFFKRQELEDGDYTMDHTASVFLLDSNGAFRSTIAYGEDTNTAIEKIRNLTKG